MLPGCLRRRTVGGSESGQLGLRILNLEGQYLFGLGAIVGDDRPPEVVRPAHTLMHRKLCRDLHRLAWLERDYLPRLEDRRTDGQLGRSASLLDVELEVPYLQRRRAGVREGPHRLHHLIIDSLAEVGNGFVNAEARPAAPTGGRRGR